MSERTPSGFSIVNVHPYGESEPCPGCTPDHPPMGGCSACLSESVAIILYDAARDQHCMPLCFSCAKVFWEWHQEIAAERKRRQVEAAEIARRSKKRKKAASRPAAKGGAA